MELKEGLGSQLPPPVVVPDVKGQRGCSGRQESRCWVSERLLLSRTTDPEAALPTAHQLRFNGTPSPLPPFLEQGLCSIPSRLLGGVQRLSPEAFVP